MCGLVSVWLIIDHVDRSFFFQAEDGIRYLVRSRGLGDVYKRQRLGRVSGFFLGRPDERDFHDRPSDEVVDQRVAVVGLSLIHI